MVGGKKAIANTNIDLKNNNEFITIKVQINVNNFYYRKDSFLRDHLSEKQILFMVTN